MREEIGSRYDSGMERLLTIDDDVLTAVEELAQRQGTSVDHVISELSRKALASQAKERFSRDCIPTIPMRDPTPVTVEFVNELRDRLGV